MTQSAHTTYWGVLLAFGLQLPMATPAAPQAGPPVPSPVVAQAPGPAVPYKHAWTIPVETDDELLLGLSATQMLTAGPATALEARSLATGVVTWKHPLPSWQSLVTTDSLVLGVSGDHAYALDAATGRTRWVTETTGEDTRLAASSGHLLMVSDSDLLLRELATGTPLWRAGLTAAPTAQPVIGDGRATVALADNSVVTFDMVTHQPTWVARFDLPVTRLASFGANVYAVLSDGRLCSIRARDGRTDWCFPLRVPMAGPPIADDRLVYAALLEGTLRALDRRDGAIARQDPLGHRPGAGPWLTNRALIVALTTGEFLLMDPRTGRGATRVPMPAAGVSQLLEQALVRQDGQVLASLTIAPGGDRRLSIYQVSTPFDNVIPFQPAPRMKTFTAPAARPAQSPAAR